MRLLAALTIGWTLALALPSLHAQTTERSTPQPSTETRSPRNASHEWKAGFAEAEITPARGEAMLAGFGRSRPVQGTLAPLRGQALAIEDANGRRALLFTADVLGFSRVTVESLRHKIEQAYGIPASAVCFSASHTHWGPAINFRTSFLIGAPDVFYLAKLEETLLKLAEQALADLAPAAIDYGSCEVRIGMCRRRPESGGRIGWAPYAEGSYDEHTPVLRITRRNSPKKIVLAGHACHPTSTGMVDKWSPDYPGSMRRKLESSLEDCRALFVMGCGGDAKVTVFNETSGRHEFADDPAESERAGEALAEGVLDCLRSGNLAPLASELETTLVSGELSLQTPRNRKQLEELAFDGKPRLTAALWARQMLAYPDDRRSVRYDVQAWRLGDLSLIALEGEVCADWGPLARSLATTKYAMTIGYANEVPGYIPTARIIREGGYEGETSHMVYLLPAPFSPRMEFELLTLLQRALGRSDHGASVDAPVYDDRRNLLRYGDAQGRMQDVATADDWQTRRTHILANVQRALGPLPGAAFRVPLDLKVVSEEQREGYTRKTIAYNVDPYDRVESYLLIPDNLRGKAPAVLALHSTHASGKDRAAQGSEAYGEELAQRGYVVILPDYWPMGKYRGRRYDPHQHGYASGAIKGVWNHLRAIDVLESLAEVDADRIGCLGWSLGGYNALFASAFEPRIKAIATNAGYNSFVDYAASPYGGGNLANWSLDKHIRRIKTIYEDDPRQLPFDFPELVAAIAPRPLLTIAPRNDDIFVLPGVVKCLDAARPAYELLGAATNLHARFPEGDHGFPQPEREAAYEFLDEALGKK